MTTQHAGLVRRSAAAAGLITALVIAAPAPRVALSAAPERAAEGAVVVTALTATERGTGAGTIVAIAGDEVRVVTAKHVAIFGALSIRFDDERTAPAHIVSLLPGHDLAVIEASVSPDAAAELRAAHVAAPLPNEPVHVWGSGFDGPAYETGSIVETGGDLPDGPARGRYELHCDLCHRGDSGAGVFDSRGALVGVYVGYWTYETGARVGVAELPVDAVRAALAAPAAADRIVATSNGVAGQNRP